MPEGGAPTNPNLLSALGLNPAQQTNSLNALAAAAGTSGGNWKLELADNAQNNQQTTLNGWYLTIQHPSSTSASYDITSGNIGWGGGTGDGGGVAFGQQPGGNLYWYKWPCCGGNYTDFFTVNGQGRTNGLIQGSGTGNTPDPQWPFLGTINFAVNPVNGNQVLISSSTGNVFLTETAGSVWTQLGDNTTFGGSRSLAMAFGAPDPTAPAGVGNFDNFLYVGTDAGKIYMSQDGGGVWTNISAGLSGSIQSIVPNPTRGSHEAYAVTSNGVFHIADSTAANASWTNITGNLYSLRRNVLPNTSSSISVSTNNQYVQPLYKPIQAATPGPNNTVVPSVTEIDLNVSGHLGQTVGDMSATLNSLQMSGAGAGLGTLQIVLVAPDGKTRITLFQNSSATGTALSNTTFSDLGAALTNNGSPFTGSFQPSDSTVKLSDFEGQYVDGTWKLLIYNSSTTSTGTIGNFNLYFSAGSTQAAGGLSSLAVDWRYNLPDSPTNPGTSPNVTHPVLYAGGTGGVFRSLDDGKTWSLYPDGTTNVTGASNFATTNSSPWATAEASPPPGSATSTWCSGTSIRPRASPTFPRVRTSCSPPPTARAPTASGWRR